ncbi:intermembrane lipid transfer protein VPS13B-like [Physella acuta]|uniref:intermembrane lipid transfer protein VPS13B-like n=1 Tax=Physella acuta TaxID=109671 RepID=UPI0027DCCF44|nr:intermembrane lipid transfer protein VPS13B-like [Physella acuta]
MFKVESYITPLLMGYLDKYVKLRQEDFQLSLWGGDAVLNNLDLRLDELEKVLQLPVMFQSGHIHELRLHVPWTKLGSEPVVITINTVECILKVRDTAYEGGSSSQTKSSSGKSLQSRQKSKKRPQPVEDLPPGYLQTIVNRIINNVTFIINNFILKFVEDDIVISVNIKSAECYSVDREWNRAFVDLAPDDLALRKVLNFADLTVCLDKTNSSGHIESYQEPMAYRCAVTCRLHMEYESISAKLPSVTRLNVFCDTLNLSLTDTQLPLFVRFIELCIAMYYGSLDIPDSVAGSTSEEQQSSQQTEVDGETTDIDTNQNIDQSSQGWASWAWSYVPQILPTEEEQAELDRQMEEQGRRGKPPPLILSIGFYIHHGTIVFKMTEKSKESSELPHKKMYFHPFLKLCVDGLGLEVLLQGVNFCSIQCGITSLKLTTCGNCICDVNDEKTGRCNILLSGGEDLDNKIGLNYISNSLFDDVSWENRGQRAQHVVDGEEHRQIFTDQYALQRFGAFWVDSLYIYEQEEKPGASSNSSDSDSSELLFLKEFSTLRFVFGNTHLHCSSTLYHRISKLVHCATNHQYQPYGSSKQSSATTPEERPKPTEEQVKSLEEFIPTTLLHMMFIKPTVTLLQTEHPYCDVTKKNYRCRQKKRDTKTPEESHQPPPIAAVVLSASRFDLQITRPMYPGRLVKLVTAIAGPSSNLLHHSHSHMQIKLFSLQAGLQRCNGDGTVSRPLTLLPPCSFALYLRSLVLPKLWTNSSLPLREWMYEIPNASININKASVLLCTRVISSWLSLNEPIGSEHTLNDSLLDDLFPVSGESTQQNYPLLELGLSGLEFKSCDSALVNACVGSLSLLHIFLYTPGIGGKMSVIPILYGPSDTSKICSPDFFHEATLDKAEVRCDCITATFQKPKHAGASEAQALALVDCQGLCVWLDPGLISWFHYCPQPRVGLKAEPVTVTLDLSLAQMTSPLNAVSQASVRSTSSPSHPGLSRQQTSVSQPPQGRQTSCSEETEAADVQTESLGKLFAYYFPLVRMLHLQLELKPCAVFLPKTGVPNSESSSDILTIVHQARQAGRLSDTLVLCVPTVTVTSTMTKPMSVAQELPVRSIQGSLIGEKLPWSIKINNICVYSLLSSRPDPQFLVHPMDIVSTVAVTCKYNPPTSENISNMAICLHVDVGQPQLDITPSQVMRVLFELRCPPSSQSCDCPCACDWTVAETAAELVLTIRLALTPPVTVFTSSTCNCLHQLHLCTTVFEMVANVVSNTDKLLSDCLKLFASKGHQLLPSAKPSHSLKKSSSSVHKIESVRSAEVTENPGTEMSEDFSHEGSPLHENIIEDKLDVGVKLSLWLQLMFPRLQFTLYSTCPLTHREQGLLFVLEHFDLSMDSQSVYSKAKVTLGSVSVQHSVKSADGTWNWTDPDGIVLSFTRQLPANLHLVSNKLWASDTAAVGTQPHDPANKDKKHGVLSVTLTRALCKNVKKRLRKANVELPSVTEVDLTEPSLTENTSSLKLENIDFCYHQYLSEICVKAEPFDVVLKQEVMLLVANLFSGLSKGEKRDNRRQPSPVKPDFPTHPAGTSSKYASVHNLPLVYADLGVIRVFVPCSNTPPATPPPPTPADQSGTTPPNDSADSVYIDIDSAGLGGQSSDDPTQSRAAPKLTGKKRVGVVGETSSTLNHNMLVLQIQSCLLQPHADNPLPRTAQEKEVYLYAVQSGLTHQPGSVIEDRQYQLDVKGVSCSSGVWEDLVNEVRQGKLQKPATGSMVQFPALEWNTFLMDSVSQKNKDIRLVPLAAPCDFCLVVAPPITYTPQCEEQDLARSTKLICGYTAELNVTSDLDLYISTNQIQLLSEVTAQFTKSLSSRPDLAASQTLTASPSPLLHREAKKTRLQQVEAAVDSGVESDLSTLTLDRGQLAPAVQHLLVPGVQKTEAQRGLTEAHHHDVVTRGGSPPAMVPVDVLVTASRISCTVYTHKILEESVTLEMPLFRENQSQPAREEKSDVRDCTPDNLEVILRKGVKDTNMVEVEGSRRESETGSSEHHAEITEETKSYYEDSIRKIIPEGSACIIPFAYVYITQPHCLLASHSARELRLEGSCYDVLVKGASDKHVSPIDEYHTIPDCTDFNVHWLETRPGQPHPYTGIPPSLLTVRFTKDSSNPDTVSIQIERPLCVKVSQLAVEQISSFTSQLLDMLAHGVGEMKPEPRGAEVKVSQTRQQSGVLSLAERFELRSAQLVVVVEMGDSVGVTGSVEGMTLEADVRKLTSDDHPSFDGHLQLKDILVKTSYERKSRQVVGPFSLNSDAVLTWVPTGRDHFFPQVLFVVETNLILATFGQEHLFCINEFIQQVNKLTQKLIGSNNAMKSKEQAADTKLQKVAPYFVQDRSHDDLRSGGFQFIEGPDNSSVLPSPNEIIFSQGGAGDSSSMTWCYPHPRVLTAIHLIPVPFYLSASTQSLNSSTTGASTVPCVLQYWDELRDDFVNVVTFHLSENEPVTVDLPDTRQVNAHELVAAKTWRVVLQEEGLKKDSRDVAVLPSSLAACMCVDSAFIPSIIPALKFSITIPELEVHLCHHLKYNSTGESCHHLKYNGTGESRHHLKYNGTGESCHHNGTGESCHHLKYNGTGESCHRLKYNGTGELRHHLKYNGTGESCHHPKYNGTGESCHHLKYNGTGESCHHLKYNGTGELRHHLKYNGTGESCHHPKYNGTGESRHHLKYNGTGESCHHLKYNGTGESRHHLKYNGTGESCHHPKYNGTGESCHHPKYNGTGESRHHLKYNGTGESCHHLKYNGTGESCHHLKYNGTGESCHHLKYNGTGESCHHPKYNGTGESCHHLQYNGTGESCHHNGTGESCHHLQYNGTGETCHHLKYNGTGESCHHLKYNGTGESCHHLKYNGTGESCHHLKYNGTGESRHHLQYNGTGESCHHLKYNGTGESCHHLKYNGTGESRHHLKYNGTGESCHHPKYNGTGESCHHLKYNGTGESCHHLKYNGTGESCHHLKYNGTGESCHHLKYNGTGESCHHLKYNGTGESCHHPKYNGTGESCHHLQYNGTGESCHHNGTGESCHHLQYNGTGETCHHLKYNGTGESRHHLKYNGTGESCHHLKYNGTGESRHHLKYNGTGESCHHLKYNGTGESCHHPKYNGTEPPRKLSLYQMSPDICDQLVFARVNLLNTTATMSHITGRESKSSFKLSTKASLDILEHGHLTMDKVLEPAELSLTSSVSTTGHKLDVNGLLQSDKVKLKVGKSAVHTLNMAVAAWTHFSPTNSGPLIIFSHYIICNNTTSAIRFGQAGTDENILLNSREMYGYSWRSYTCPQLLHLCMDKPTWKWTDPFPIDKEGPSVQSVTARDQSYVVILRVKRLSGLQIQITVCSQLVVCNRLSQAVSMRFSQSGVPSNTASKSRSNSSGLAESYVINPGDHLPSITSNEAFLNPVQFRLAGFSASWSHDIFLSGDRMKDNQMIKIALPDGTSYFHVWCRIFCQHFYSMHQKLGTYRTATMKMIMLTPLYVVRTHLPRPLFIHLNSPKQSQEMLVKSEGREFQLHCTGGDITHLMSFRLGAEMQLSDPAVVLSTGLIGQLTRALVNTVDIENLCEQKMDIVQQHWPYLTREDERDLEMDSISALHQLCPLDTRAKTTSDEDDLEPQPSIDLNIRLSEYIPGCDTLLVEVAPTFLVHNATDLDVLISGVEGRRWSIRPNHTMAPPLLKGEFTLAIKNQNSLSEEKKIPMSSESQDYRRYNDDIGKVLFIDGYVHVSFTLTLEESNQKQLVFLVFLTVTSEICHEIRVVCIREHFSLTNETDLALGVRLLALPLSLVPVKMADMDPLVLTCAGRQGDKSGRKVSKPLLIWSTTRGEKSDDVETKDSAGEATYVCYLSFSKLMEQGSSDWSWSLPVRIVSSKDGHRTTTSIPDQHRSEGSEVTPITHPVTVATQLVKGVTHVVLITDPAPACVLENLCPFPLQYGQACDKLLVNGAVIQEQVELVADLPWLPPGGWSHYTPPSVNTEFVNRDTLTLPRLHFRAMDIQVSGVPETGFSEWSSATQISGNMDAFVRLPGFCDLKVMIEVVGMVTHLIVRPVSKAEITAKEIRTRLTDHGTVKTQAEKSGKFGAAMVTWETPVTEASSDLLLTESTSQSSILHGSSPSQLTQPRHPLPSSYIRFTERTKRAITDTGMSVTLGASCCSFSLVLQDESSAEVLTELTSLHFKDLFLAAYPVSKNPDAVGHETCYTFSATTIQLDNQQYGEGMYDFPVVILPQKSTSDTTTQAEVLNTEHMSVLELHAVLRSRAFLHLQIVTYSDPIWHQFVIETVDVSVKPLSLYVDDSFIYRLVQELENFSPSRLSSRMEAVVPAPGRLDRKLPALIRLNCYTLSHPIRIKHFTVQPINLLLSVHASLKLFLASDHTPLNVGKFERVQVFSTTQKLGHALAMHYASAAIFRAGIVVGSLEILGNPTGLVRSIGTGVSDLISLPYYGLTRGPGAFVSGLSRGIGSLVKNVSAGMITSVTNFASSVSRNMDRLSFDSSHLERQEENRRNRPVGVSDGLKQGLTGFGLSLLGAVAGLADQPMQTLLSTGAPDERRGSASSAASGFVTGMGKGLVGVFTKPIGGAAEFVSQTGQGILHGTGLGQLPARLDKASVVERCELPDGQFKYSIKIFSSLPSPELLLAVPALTFDLMETEVKVVLLLTPDVLVVVNVEEDAQQQALALTELECKPNYEEGRLILQWKDQIYGASSLEQTRTSNKDRVAAFIDTQKVSEKPSTPPCLETEPTLPANGQSVSEVTSQSQQISRLSSSGSLPDLKTSSVPSQMTSAPQYEFELDPHWQDLFVTLFQLTKNRLQGRGFPL